MSASGQYLSADPSAFPTSEIDPYMNNPMIRQSTAPNMIGLNNAAFMQPQPPNPHGGPNPPMGMLPGGPDMRFPQGHAAMVPRNMAMRPGPSARPPGMNPAMGGMGGLQGNPQMPGGGMGFPAGMMPSGGMGGVRRVVSNPVGGMGGMPPSMMQQQHQQLQQHQQQQQQQHQHQQHQMHQQHMLRLQHQQQQQQRVEMMRSGMVPTPVRGTPMASLSQPPSLNQVQPSNMSANAFPNPGPPPPSSPRTHTPVMNLPTGQQQQQRAPAHMFDMEYSHNQFQQRPMMGNGQFPFPPSSTPPLNMNESFPPSGSTPGRAPGAFPPTPAQQLSMNHSNENYGFMSPRPPSQQQQTRAPQHSPQHHDLRPESQPPPSGPPTGRTLTPRPGRVPMQPSPAQGTPPSNSSAPAAIAPRPPAPGSSDGTMMTGSASPPEMAPGPPVPRMTANPLLYSIGYGQGVLRMMQFSGILGSINPQAQSQKMQVSYWDLVIREYFTPKAVMKLTLWRDSMKNEAKPFEIGVPILPRFFLVTTQSGVKSMSLTLDGARERVASPGHAIVECVAAEWTCRYTNGHVVTLRGPLKARLVMCSLSPTSATPFVLKFDDLEFDATSHDKYVLIDSILGRRPVPDQRRGDDPSPPAGGDEDRGEPRVPIETGSIPGEPVNGFGIPQATMRCLELAESVGQMAELISYARDQTVGPIDALKAFAQKLREEQPGLLSSNPGAFFGLAGQPAQGNTLYSSAPSSVINAAQTPASTSSPQNGPPSAHNSPQKQHKMIPAKATAAAAVSAAPSTPTGTPPVPNATLKRKIPADNAASAVAEPPSKRTTRRRRGTGGGG